MNRMKHVRSGGLIAILIAFELTSFTLLAFRGDSFDFVALIFAVILVGLLLFQFLFLRGMFAYVDRFILIIANTLVGIGMVMQYRLGTEVAFHQLIMLALGICAMFLCIWAMQRPAIFRRLTWPFMLLSIGILIVLYFVGEEQGGAKNWISLASVTFQPSEFVKLALVFVLADQLSDITSVKEAWPAVLFVAATCMLLVMERDLGAALLLAGTAVIVFYAATGRKFLTFLALGAGAGGAVASYYLFDHVKTRVMVWLNPWATYATSGYQIAQGLMAIASGGFWGTGLGLGSPTLIPAYRTDYIFAVICEEFGVIVGVCVIALFLIFIVRGVSIALNAPDRFLMLVAFGCTVLISLQSFIIIAGVIKMIPLTGITLPFISYGGSSIVMCMILLGILESVSIHGAEAMRLTLESDELSEDDA